MNLRKWGLSLLALLAVTLVVGVTSAVPAEACSNSTYVVRPGDTLYRISVTFGVRMDVIASANGIYNYNLIYVGQTLIIPCGGSVSYNASYSAPQYVAPQYVAPQYVAPQYVAPQRPTMPQGPGAGGQTFNAGRPGTGGQAFNAGGPGAGGPGQPGGNPPPGGGRP